MQKFFKTLKKLGFEGIFAPKRRPELHIGANL